MVPMAPIAPMINPITPIRAGAANAALLAVAVLALGDPSLREKLLAYRRAQTDRVLQERLETVGGDWSDRPSDK